VSFTGNHPGEPWGSFTTNAPSSVGIQPSIDSSGSTIGSGCPVYSTTSTKGWPFFSFGRGSIESSCPSWVNDAACPPTVTFVTS
jgi:hypothetical protein